VKNRWRGVTNEGGAQEVGGKGRPRRFLPTRQKGNDNKATKKCFAYCTMANNS